jgi:glutamate/aspartate transport system substrate-binding protein
MSKLAKATVAMVLLAATAAYAQGLEGRLQRIAEKRTVNIAYRADAMPFSFADDKGAIDGFAIDLCKRVVHSLERQLGVLLKINWVPVTSQSRFDAVARGRADMECGSSTITLERLKQVDFSSVTFVESTGLMVKAAAGLRSISDLSGKKIAVVSGTTNERVINTQLKRRAMDAAVLPFTSRDEALEALESGKADAFASDRLLLIGAVGKAKDRNALALLPDQLSYEPYGIVLPRGDSAFRLAVNTGLSQVYSSGEIGDIFRRWFAGFGPPPAIIEAIYVLGVIPE